MVGGNLLEHLERVVHMSPNVEELSLERREIHDLAPFIHLLSRLPKLRILKLGENDLRGLPHDLSALRNLVYLDISSNPIAGVDAVLSGLQTLPELKHLYVDLPNDGDEDTVILELSGLATFNGTPLTEDDDIEDFIGGGVGPGHHQHPQHPLTHQPQHMPTHQQHIPTHSMSAAPSHQMGYGQQQPVFGGMQQEFGGFGPTEMEAIQQLFAAASRVSHRPPQNVEFDAYTTSVVSNLQQKLHGEGDAHNRQSEILRAKEKMYTYLFKEIARSAVTYDPQLAQVLDSVQAAFAELLASYAQLVAVVQNDTETKLSLMRRDMENATREIDQLMQMQQNMPPPQLQNPDWQRERDGLIEEIGWLRTDKERLQNRVRQLELARNKMGAQMADQAEQLRRQEQQIAATQQQRPFDVDMGLAQPQPNYTNANAPHKPSEHQRGRHNSYDGPKEFGNFEPSEGTGMDGEYDDYYPEEYSEPGPAGGMGMHGSGYSGPSGGQQGGRIGGHGTHRPVPGRSLSLRQLKDIIEDVYASKSKFDIKCGERHEPHETMEQYLYTYLNQRYGLKNLILDWSQSILAAVRKYSAEDNDVALFGKILRNEIDEEFRFVQRQLKETVHDLLKVYLRGKFGMKSEDDIARILQKRVSGNILEEEWVDIVKYMYNSEDAVTIINRVKEITRARAQQQGGGRTPASAKSRRSASPIAGERVSHALPYSQLLKVLLDFQLHGHERFLAKFVKLFRQFDVDKDGILHESEFRGLLIAIDGSKTDDEVDQLLDLIDPHSTQVITFSECVTFLSSELVSLMSEKNAETSNGGI